MYGQLGKSDYFTLSSGFERGSQKKIEYDGPDLGGLQKIRAWYFIKNSLKSKEPNLTDVRRLLSSKGINHLILNVYKT